MALLHDFGRIGLPDAILGKQDPLDEAEREVVCTHPVIGEQIALSRSGWYLRGGCYGAASGVLTHSSRCAPFRILRLSRGSEPQ